MRWQALFQDLEIQMESLQRQQQTEQAREQIRTQLAEVPLVDRLRGNMGHQLGFHLAGKRKFRGRLERCYEQWLLVASTEGEVLIPAGALIGVSGLKSTNAAPAGASAQRLTLGHALRALARDRSSVEVQTAGDTFTGIFGFVGQDWVQLRTHLPGEPRLSKAEVTVPHAAICAVLNRS